MRYKGVKILVSSLFRKADKMGMTVRESYAARSEVGRQAHRQRDGDRPTKIISFFYWRPFIRIIATKISTIFLENNPFHQMFFFFTDLATGARDKESVF